MSKNQLLYGLIILLVVITYAAFQDVLENGFYNYDDDVFVTANNTVQQGITAGGLEWAFTTRKASIWHPLTWISHMMDCQLFGMNPRYHHATSLLLHIGSTILLFLCFCWMTSGVWESAFVAGVFALHPLHIESVSWIAERKDVLSIFFWMLTMLSYIYYTRRPSTRRMLLVCTSLTLGLMSKPMLVTLPFIFLLLDYWPLGRLGLAEAGEKRKSREKNKNVTDRTPFARLLSEKLPLIMLILIFSVVTYVVEQKGGTTKFGENIPLGERAANAIISYLKYLGKAIWPSELSIFYPFPKDPYPVWEVSAAAALLTGISLLVFLARRRFPYHVAGWFWFLVTLIPVIGIIQIGWQSISDRYMYVPIVGLAIMAAWGFSYIFSEVLRFKRGFVIFCGAVFCLLFVGTKAQLTYWKDDISLFGHARRVTSGNWIADYNLGVAYAQKNDMGNALRYVGEAVGIEPEDIELQVGYGQLLSQTGDFEKASIHFKEAVRINPNYPGLAYSYGYALLRCARDSEAIPYFEESARVNPRDQRSRYLLGTIRVKQKKYSEAIEQFSAALKIDPSFTLSAQALENARKLLDVGSSSAPR